MQIILFLVGLLAAAAGAALVAMGLMQPEAALSPAQLSSGTVALIGGLVVMGLAAVAGQLGRIARGLDRQPALAVAAEETIEPMAQRPRHRAPAASAAAAEQAAATAAATAVAAGAAAPAAEAATSPFAPEAPSPEASATATVAAGAAAGAPEVKVEPRGAAEPAPSLVDRTRDLFEKPLGDLPQPQPQPPPAAAAAPAAKLDVVPARDWPRAAPGTRIEPRAGPAPPIAPPMVPSMERPAPRVDTPEAEAVRGAPAAPAAPAPATPTVLKSGVIEGMAYTLYSDGSIEAELAQGAMRFDSIPALRAYLREIG